MRVWWKPLVCRPSSSHEPLHFTTICGERVVTVTPHVCRLRDLTYAGRIFVDVRYVMDRKILTARNVPIGMIPIMLRSSNCVLTGKTPSEMAKVRRM
jgi:DNA-directed RNA polymerase beta subunit